MVIAGRRSARSAEARGVGRRLGIGKPDMVFELPTPFEVPARGVIDYQHVIVPTNFTEDRWIQAAEIRPTKREVVHHLIAFVREPKSKWFRGQPAGAFFTAPKVSTDEETEAGALPSDFLVGYAPGQPAEILEPGQGKLIKAGSDIVFQMHYTPHGHARTDRTRLGLVFAKQPPKERVLRCRPSTARSGFRRVIRTIASTRASSWARTSSSPACIRTCTDAARTSSTVRCFRPAGRTSFSECLASTGTGRTGQPEQPIALPKGARIDCTAHFDNSPNNPEAADPTKEVRWAIRAGRDDDRVLQPGV